MNPTNRADSREAWSTLAVAGLLLVAVACAGVSRTASAAPPLSKPARSAIHTVFVIVMENHNWSSIAGSSSAPYIRRTLLRLGAHATQYYNPPANHPSLPNYLWLEAGTNFGISNDDPPSVNHQGTTAHLVSLLRKHGISWKSYQEGISTTSCPLTSMNLYAPKHDPFVYFNDVTGANNPASAYCRAHVRPYGELARDLRRTSTTARYNFITPNLCDDMHDTCAPVNDAIKQGDNWLARAVPPILHSAAYKRGGVLFITWDEGEGGDGPIGMIVLSPYARKGYANSIRYTHSSTLRSVERIFNVRPYLGGAAHSNDLSNFFTRFP
jgi:phosphatidylinositol-3-phosphatase